jgi:cytochrome c553
MIMIRSLTGDGRQAFGRLCLGVCMLSAGLTAAGVTPQARADAAPFVVPAWAFPAGPALPLAPVEHDRAKPLRVPGSDATFTAAQVHDFFAPPDWHPESHDPMPAIVASGVTPDVFACGYCHTPGGQGRPENAALAGLPAGYIEAQVADYRTGARRSAEPAPSLPVELMTRAARHASPAQVAEAAEYFSRQKLGRRVEVIESARVPRTRQAMFVYVADERGGGETMRAAVAALDLPGMIDGAAYAASLPP